RGRRGGREGPRPRPGPGPERRHRRVHRHVQGGDRRPGQGRPFRLAERDLDRRPVPDHRGRRGRQAGEGEGPRHARRRCRHGLLVSPLHADGGPLTGGPPFRLVLDCEVMDDLDAKLAALRRNLASTGGGMVACAGGTDSAFLLAAAADALGERAVAATGVSPSLPERELDDARALAAELGIRHLVVPTHEGERPGYLGNGPDRCFFCKDELFEVLGPLAAAEGLALAVGTNTDDLGDHPPGQRAAAEHGVLTPLVAAGLSKAEVRQASRRRGLRTADKPAAACLASRIAYGVRVTPARLSRGERARAPPPPANPAPPCLASRVAYGVQVTPARLSRVERAEALLRSFGLAQLRVRDHGDLARVEVPLGALADLVEPGRRARLGARSD